MIKPQTVLFIPSFSRQHAFMIPYSVGKLWSAKMERMWGCNEHTPLDSSKSMKEFLLLNNPISDRFKLWIQGWLQEKCLSWDSFSLNPTQSRTKQDDALCAYACLAQCLLEKDDIFLKTLFKNVNKESSQLYIHSYVQTALDVKLLDQINQIGIRSQPVFSHHNTNIIEDLNTKQGMHDLFLSLDLPCLQMSSSICYTQKMLLLASNTLIKDGVSSLRWKPNHGDGGLGQHVCSQKKLNQSSIKAIISDEELAAGYICEENMTTMSYSASTQGWIEDVDAVNIHCIQRQHIKDAHIHIGSDMRVPFKYLKPLAQQSLLILKAISRIGGRGPVSIDFVISKSGDIYPIDLNIRHGAGTTISSTVRRLIGPFDIESGYFHDRENPNHKSCFTYYDTLNWSEFFKPIARFKVPSPPNPDHFLLFLEQHCEHLIYNPEKKSGFIFMHLGALEETGQLGIAFIGDNYHSIASMEHQLKQTLKQNWSSKRFNHN